MVWPMSMWQYFLDHVDLETDECIIWPGARIGGGYGGVHHEGRLQRVHRLALERHVGPCPPGMEALHTCQPRPRPGCFNIRHLRWGTHGDNMDTARRPLITRATRSHPDGFDRRRATPPT